MAQYSCSLLLCCRIFEPAGQSFHCGQFAAGHQLVVDDQSRSHKDPQFQKLFDIGYFLQLCREFFFLDDLLAHLCQLLAGWATGPHYFDGHHRLCFRLFECDTFYAPRAPDWP